MGRVLVVEADAELAAGLADDLRAEGLEVDLLHTGAAAFARSRAGSQQLIVLGLGLPDVSGVELVELLRSTGSAAIIALADCREDAAVALRLGASVVFIKPVAVQAVVRCGSKLVSSGAPWSAPARDDIDLDAAAHEVRVAGTLVALTALEFRLLKTLLDHVGAIQTREVLLRDVWGIEVGLETRTLDTFIKRLRRRLGPAGHRIETVRRVGYRLLPARAHGALDVSVP